MGASASAIDVACCAKRQRDARVQFSSSSNDEQMEPPRDPFAKYSNMNDEQMEPTQSNDSSPPRSVHGQQSNSVSARLTTRLSVAASLAQPSEAAMETQRSVRQLQSQANDEDRKKAKEIDKASALVSTNCLKFPMHQTSFFGTTGAKERFVAAAPADEVAPDGEWGVYVKRWRRGKLGYWADQGAYERREAPKGCLDLLSITKVSMPEGGTPEDVSVKHRDSETGTVMRLVLRFPDTQRAEAWRVAMRALRSLLQ